MATGRLRSGHVGRSFSATSCSLPVVLAPCGLVRLMHPDGAAGAARAAAARGTISVLSTVAGAPLEKVATAAPGAPMWFQLYARAVGPKPRS